MVLHQSWRCPVRLVKGAAAMVNSGSPATDFWAGGLRVGDREFVALLDSWLRPEADIPELLRIAVHSRLLPAYPLPQTRR
jgi:hypothetical protein